MIRDKAAAVALGSSGITETEWKILHDVGIPVVSHSATQPALIQDAKSTFIIYDPEAQTVTLPIAIAKDKGAKKLTIVVVDFPTATDIYKTDATKQKFKDRGTGLHHDPRAAWTSGPDAADATGRREQPRRRRCDHR